MSDSGSIGGRVVSELSGIVKSAAAETTKLGVDVAQKAAETVSGSSTPTPSSSDQVDQEAINKRSQEKRRYQQVLAELEDYRIKKRRESEQQEMVAEQEKHQELQKKESADKIKEQKLLGSLSRQYGGTGEVSKGKY